MSETKKSAKIQHACQCLPNDACLGLTYKTFAMGHDARFVGLMRDQAVAGVASGQGAQQAIDDAVSVGKRIGISDLLENKIRHSAKLAIAKATAPKAEKKAEKPARHLTAVPTEEPKKSATSMKAKVGRWVKDGRINGSGEFEYLDSKGKTATTTKYTLIDE